nr:hypothetical protein [Candidatus Sigynarchaeota archaeon]
MTGIFLYQAITSHEIPKDISKIAQDISHRGNHSSRVFTSSQDFLKVFLNSHQKENLVVVDDPVKVGKKIITVVDGQIDNKTALPTIIGGMRSGTGYDAETKRNRKD